MKARVEVGRDSGAARVAGEVRLRAIDGVPIIQPGDDLGRLLFDCLSGDGVTLADEDVIVVAQKIVSKAEGRMVSLADVSPSDAALELAAATDKDPRVVELILRESIAVVRQRRGLIVVRHRQGFVMANAGIDLSNVPPGQAMLLPENIDASAARLKHQLDELSGRSIGVIVSDSMGRAWRRGIVGHALGVAGLEGLIDLRGEPDLYGREMESSEVAIADELAAAAAMLMGEGRESRPLVLIRGVRVSGRQSGRQLLRDESEDLFL